VEDLVSVIVPVYNAEKYLKSCIDSIVNQTYNNLDIILVDDGSTDESGKICNEYACIDGRINVIHKPNGGIGDARNTGLAQVKGQWIVWVDSDDIIHKRQIEILLSAAKEKNADIVVAGYSNFSNDDNIYSMDIEVGNIEKTEVISDKHLYDDNFIKRYSMIFTVPWGKICSHTVYEGIGFPNVRRSDDTWTTWKLYEKAEEVVYLEKPLYFWRSNPNSCTHIFDKEHLQGLEAYKEQLEYFHSAKKQRYVEIVFASYTEMFFWCYNRMRENNIELTLLNPYLEYMRKNLNYLKLTKSLGVKQWIKYRYLIYYKIPKIIK
jgi:glycosyltransferase involved in cell wall biosynthesis